VPSEGRFDGRLATSPASRLATTTRFRAYSAVRRTRPRPRTGPRAPLPPPPCRFGWHLNRGETSSFELDPGEMRPAGRRIHDSGLAVRGSWYALCVAYAILITDNAKADFMALTARWRSTVKQSLETHLRHQPKQVSKSRIKRLRGMRRPQYRLRIDELRVFYDVVGDEVIVHAIVPKSQASEWLARYGELQNDQDLDS
jgi:mRNA interferase RelE/StbE